MKLEYAHICIKAKNLAETEHFYTQVLGLEKAFTFRKGAKAIGCYLRLNGTEFIEVFEDPAAANAPSVMAHLCLRTYDIDAARRTLQAHGIAVTEKKMGCDQSWQIWFKDPNGMDIELHEYTDASAQLTGKDVAVDW